MSVAKVEVASWRGPLICSWLTSLVLSFSLSFVIQIGLSTRTGSGLKWFYLLHAPRLKHCNITQLFFNLAFSSLLSLCIFVFYTISFLSGLSSLLTRPERLCVMYGGGDVRLASWRPRADSLLSLLSHLFLSSAGLLLEQTFNVFIMILLNLNWPRCLFLFLLAVIIYLTLVLILSPLSLGERAKEARVLTTDSASSSRWMTTTKLYFQRHFFLPSNV